MGQIEHDTTQDDQEGSLAPLGLSRSKNLTKTEGVWTPILRKALAVTFGGLALAAIGGISMAHRAAEGPTLQHLTASVAGAEPLEWLALGGDTKDTHESHPEKSSGTAASSGHGLTDTTQANGDGAPEANSSPCNQPTPEPSAPGGILPDGRVVLNVATITELQTLPGVGQKRAESIIALRARLGGFRKLSELLRVKGIGVKSLRKLSPKVTLNPPESAPEPSSVASTSGSSPPPNGRDP